MGLAGGEDLADREETAVGGHDAHRFSDSVGGDMMIGRDDAIGADCESAGERVVPLRAFIALIGGTDDHGRRGRAAIGFNAIELDECLGGECYPGRVGALASLKPNVALQRPFAFFGQCRRGRLKLEEDLAIVSGTIYRGPRDGGGSREQGGE